MNVEPLLLNPSALVFPSKSDESPPNPGKAPLELQPLKNPGETDPVFEKNDG